LERRERDRKEDFREERRPEKIPEAAESDNQQDAKFRDKSDTLFWKKEFKRESFKSGKELKERSKCYKFRHCLI